MDIYGQLQVDRYGRSASASTNIKGSAAAVTSGTGAAGAGDGGTGRCPWAPRFESWINKKLVFVTPGEVICTESQSLQHS